MDMTDPEAIDDAYARHCKDVKRYLAFDVALLANLEANHDDSRAEQTAKKKKMLIRYQQLWEVETSIPLFGASFLMGGLLVNNVMLGALLTMSTFSLWAYGAISLLFEILGASRLLGKIDSIFEEEENTLVEENAPSESSGGTAGVSSTTGVELTELDTRRRTATGLLEEGRQGAGS